MISVNQGPKNNAGLGALDYNKTFEAGAEGVRAIAKAGIQKDEQIKEAYKKMTESFQASQITVSKIEATIKQNPAIFEGLEEGNNLTSKSFKNFLQGNASQQDFNNLAAYIDSANTQKEMGEKTKIREDNTKIAQGTAEAVSMIFSGLAEDDYDNVSKADVRMAFMQVSEQYDDPAIRNAINNAGIKYSQNIEDTLDSTADIKNKRDNAEDFEKFKNAWVNSDDFTAFQILNSNPHFMDVYPRYNEYGDLMGVQSPDTIAKSMGLTRVEPKKTGAGNVSSTPVIELDIQEIEQEFLVDSVWTGDLLTEAQVEQMSDEAQKAYMNKFPLQYAEPGSTEQVESNAILSPGEVKVATASEPVKPNRPKLSSYIAEYAQGFARNTDPYKLAEAKFEADMATFRAAMIKYKEQKKIYDKNNPRGRR
jgi:hypothetical protein